MTIASVGTIGTVGNATSATTVALTTSAVCSVGNLIVLVIAVDNTQTTDGDENAITGIADNAGGGTNTWAKAIAFTNGQGGAAAGATVEIWFAVIARQINSGGTITVTFSSARASKAVTGWKYTITAAGVRVTNTATLAGDSQTALGSLNVTTASITALRVRGSALESNNSTNITPTSGWTAMTNAVSSAGTTASQQSVRAEFHVSTGTSDASNPTLTPASCDIASVYAVFQEYVTTATPITATGGATVSVGKRIGKLLSSVSVGVLTVTRNVNTPPRTGFDALTRMGPSGHGIRQAFVVPPTPFSPDQVSGLLLWLDVADSATMTVGSPFLPTDIAGCLLWLDAADAATITASGGLVSAWANKGSVGGSFVQATSGNQLSQTTNAHGNAVGCTSSGKYMSGGTNAAYDIANMTVLSVVKPAASGGNMEILTRFNDTSFSGWYYEVAWVSSGASASSKITQWDASFNNSNAGVSVTLSSLRAWVGAAYRRSSGVMAATVNGNSNTGVSHTYVPPVSSAYNILIGARDGGGPVNFIGDIHEVLMFDSGLSDADRQKLEGYLAWKWGLQADLVSGHPYASAPPAGSGGSLVSAIANKGSVGGSFTQTNSAKKFTLATTANGPGLQNLSGSDDFWMDGGTNAAYDIQQLTVFNVAYRYGSAGSYSTVLSRKDNATLDGWSVGHAWIDPDTASATMIQLDATSGYTDSDVQATLAIGASNRAIMSMFRRDATSLSGGITGITPINGVNFDTYATPVGAYKIVLGGEDLSGSPVGLWQGNIHEALLYDNPLSLANRQKVEGYLAWKWGLVSDLPVGHPYKGAPPTGGVSAITTPVAVTAAAASTALIAARNAYLRAITAAAASAVTVGRVVARLLAITASSASAFTMLRITAHPRAITASGGSTVTLSALKVILKAITTSGAATVTLSTVRSALRAITVAGASTVSITKRMVKAITVAGASAVSVSKQMVKAVTAAAASVVTIIAGVAGITRLISVAGASVVTLARVPGKVVSVVGASAVTLARVFAPIRLISVVGASAVSLARTAAYVRGVTVATASTVTIAAIRAFLRPISAASASVVTIGRSVLKGITAASASAVLIIRQTGKAISVAGASAIVIGRGVFKIVPVATASAVAVGALRAFLRPITAAGASTVLLARLAGKAVAVSSASAITIGRRLAAGLTIAVQGSAAAAITRSMSRAITAATASAVALVPFHGLVKLISVATASIGVVGRGNFRTLLTSGASAASIATKRITGIFAARPSVVVIGKGASKAITVVTASIASLFTLSLTIGRHALERMIHLLPISRTVTLEAKDRRINLLPESTAAQAKDEYP